MGKTLIGKTPPIEFQVTIPKESTNDKNWLQVQGI